MKRFLIVLLFLAVAIVSKAQTVGSATNISGTNAFPVLVSAGVYQTNSVFLTAAYKSLALGNISNTNETAIYGYIAQLPTNTLTPIIVPGYTNLYIINLFTNSFATGTNGGSFATNVSGSGLSSGWPLFFYINIGANTNSCYVP